MVEGGIGGLGLQEPSLAGTPESSNSTYRPPEPTYDIVRSKLAAGLSGGGKPTQPTYLCGGRTILFRRFQAAASAHQLHNAFEMIGLRKQIDQM